MTLRTPERNLASAESWLPLAIGAGWWLAMYPGLFGEDSLLTLTAARDGPVTVWFTACWVYVIDIVSAGTRFIPLVTLAGVLTLTYACREWARACLPSGPPRTIALAVVCATPLVGALGIQLRHDAPMTAGLLLCAAVVTRVRSEAGRLRRIDGLQLAAAGLLIATRHNGLPTLVCAAALSLLVLRPPKVRAAAVLLGAAVVAWFVTETATRASGNRHSIDPEQSVEWLMADVSCLLTDPGVAPTRAEWDSIRPIAHPADWPQPRACFFMNTLVIAPSYDPAAIEAHRASLVRTWLSLASRYPVKMTAVHLGRVRLFLPPLTIPRPSENLVPFIHSTILPNDFGLEWAFPRIAGLARLPARAWNAMRLVIANAALWLIVLGLLARSQSERRHQLAPTLLVGVSLECILLATAPISEGRYGLFILITGQMTALHWLLMRWRPTSPQARGGVGLS